MRRIGGVFGRSAFGPIHEHMLKVMECIELLHPLIESMIAGDFKKIGKIADRMCKAEGAADMIKNGIRDELSGSIFSSVERSDILFLLKVQDDIADDCENIAKLLRVRNTPMPKEVAADCRALSDQVTEAGNLLSETTSQLCKVLETSFDRKEVEKTLSKIDIIQRKEFETDVTEQKFLENLFKVEDEVSPVTVVFLMQIARLLASIADDIENTGDCIRRMVGHR